jgi:hypothetical protein
MVWSHSTYPELKSEQGIIDRYTQWDYVNSTVRDYIGCSRALYKAGNFQVYF